jgi:hypothetical protein
MKSRILSAIFRPFMDDEGRRAYPQSWWFVPVHESFWRFLRWPIQTSCRILGGHELSANESAYAGCDYIDKWCRWCNKRVRVPKETIHHAERPRTKKGDLDVAI